MNKTAKMKIDLRQGRTEGKGTVPIKIGILGTGHIGKTLARKLAEAGHDVKVANSRGPLKPTR